MVAVTRNHEVKGLEYYEISTTIRITSKLVRKIYIKYIGKDASKINLRNIRRLTFKSEKSLENLKKRINSMSIQELFSNSEFKEIRKQLLDEKLKECIDVHGNLNGRHLKIMQNVLGKEEISLNDLDQYFKDKINLNNRASKTIIALTTNNDEYLDNLQEISRLKTIIEKIKVKQVIKSDLGGYGGAFDMNTDEFKVDKEFKTQYSGLIEEYSKKIQMLEFENNKFESENTEAFTHLRNLVKTNDLENFHLNVDIKRDRRHHIDDVMEVYTSVKRYKALQLAKLKFRDQINDNKQLLKMQFINDESTFNNFNEIKNTYSKIFTYDYACDYLDNNLFKPISLKSWEKGKTKKFLNNVFKQGHITRQFVNIEKGKTDINYMVNYIDTINEGKSNLLRRYSGISKNRMKELISHKNLDFIENINDINNERKSLGKYPFKIDRLHKMYQSTLIRNGITNKKEFAFMLSLVSNQDLKESSRNAINFFNTSKVIEPKKVIKKSYEKVKEKTKKDLVNEELAKYYGENYKEILGI